MSSYTSIGCFNRAQGKTQGLEGEEGEAEWAKYIDDKGVSGEANWGQGG